MKKMVVLAFFLPLLSLSKQLYATSSILTKASECPEIFIGKVTMVKKDSHGPSGALEKIIVRFSNLSDEKKIKELSLLKNGQDKFKVNDQYALTLRGDNLCRAVKI